MIAPKVDPDGPAGPSFPTVGASSHPIWEAIIAERLRQAAKWEGVHEHGKGDCSSPDVAPTAKATILSEELGEIARAVLDGDTESLRTELVQLAACCVAWLEMFDD